MAFIKLSEIQKIYQKKQVRVPVLNRLNLSIESGEFVALMGPSGSGKSTLLNLVGGLDRPTAGQVKVGEAHLEKMDERELTAWRSRYVGFIFQMYHLIPVLTAAQNVELPLTLFGMSRSERRQRVELALSVVGLADRSDHKPAQMSGGEEQRVAVARAIVTDPQLILADEPTGNLDAESALVILEILEKLNAEFDKTILLVTHDHKAASHGSRLVHLEKGVLFEDAAGSAVEPHYETAATKSTGRESNAPSNSNVSDVQEDSVTHG